MMTKDSLKRNAVLLLQCAVLAALFCGSFSLANLLSFGRVGIEPAIPLDGIIPFVPQAVYVYVLAFAQWAGLLVYFIFTFNGHDRRRMVIAVALSLITSIVIFVVMPTYTVRPEITGSSFSEWLLGLIYAVDTPTHLFPSLHVFASWALARIAMKSDKLPMWAKVVNYVFSILVIASVVLTKQHLFLDIPSAIIIFEVWYAVSEKLADTKAAKKLLTDI